MSNNLFKQVYELIKTTTAQSPNSITVGKSQPVAGAYPISPNPVNMDNSIYSELLLLKAQVATLTSKLGAMRNYVIKGLDVFAYQGKQIAVTTGTALLTNGIQNYIKLVDYTIPESDSINIILTINTDTIGTKYVIINGTTGQIQIVDGYTYIDIPLAKLMINVAGGSIANDANATFTNNYIVSGKDLAFDNAMALDDETKFLIKDAVKDILAENILGTMTLNESLKIENQQGSVKLDSSSLKILDDGALTAQFNRNGTYFYGASGAIVSQYTKNGATVGNIAVLPNSIQSVNYQSGQRGFKLDDAGNAEFNRVSVRGHIGAYSGTIGNWVIGRDRLINKSNTTGLAPKDYPFYAGQTFANRASAPFRVSASGAVWATNAIISGTVTAALGNIGGWSISSNKLSGGTTILYASGLIKCSNAQISGYISARSGLIGGWKLGTNTMSSTNGKLILLANGSGEIRVGTASSSIRILGGTTASIQSSNYSNSVVNPKGFKFSNDGTLEAVDGVFRGKLVGNVFVKNEVNVAGGSLVLTTSTRLNMVSGLGAAVTTVVVESAVFSNNDIIKIGVGTELLRVTAGGGTTSLTVTRGYNSTTPATANNKSTIYKIGVYNTANKGYIELLGESNVVKIHRVNDVAGTLTDTIVTELGLMTQGTKAGQFGLYAGTAAISGNIRAASGNIGGWSITADRISAGSTILYASGLIRCSNVNISGTITSTAGKIGGWTIGSLRLLNNNLVLHSNGTISGGTGNDIFKFSSVDATYRTWIGNATAANAPFSVTKAGALKASNAQISGTVTATQGKIGAWKINTLGVLSGASTVSGSVNLRSSGLISIYRTGVNGLSVTQPQNALRCILNVENAGYTYSGGTPTAAYFNAIGGNDDENRFATGIEAYANGNFAKGIKTFVTHGGGDANIIGVSTTIQQQPGTGDTAVATALSAVCNTVGGYPGTGYGVYAKTYGNFTTGTNFGGYFYASGACDTIIASYNIAKAGTGNTGYGVTGIAQGTGTLYGGYYDVEPITNATTSYGIYSRIRYNTSSGSNYAGYFYASGACDSMIGTFCKAKAGTGNVAYGVYAVASGAGTKYAGYFVGNVSITGNIVTSVNVTSAVEMRALRLGGTTYYTISGGNIFIDGSVHGVYSETGTTDDLVNIYGGRDGQILVIYPYSVAHITVKTTGNLYISGGVDFIMNHDKLPRLILMKYGNSTTDPWYEISRSINAA